MWPDGVLLAQAVRLPSNGCSISCHSHSIDCWSLAAIAGKFVTDTILAPSARGVDDVSHAIAAVGSRHLEKAVEFVNKFCPEGAAAQIDGLVTFKPLAVGSYSEVYQCEVSIKGKLLEQR
jgi:hypothetical protein